MAKKMMMNVMAGDYVPGDTVMSRSEEAAVKFLKPISKNINIKTAENGYIISCCDYLSGNPEYTVLVNDESGVFLAVMQMLKGQ